MKFFCKYATVLAVFTLFFAVTSCKNSISSDDGMTKPKLETPTNLVVNSAVDASLYSSFFPQFFFSTISRYKKILFWCIF